MLLVHGPAVGLGSGRSLLARGCLIAPSVTLADVRRKLEVAEVHVEPDDNDGATINAAIDGLRRITAAERLA